MLKYNTCTNILICDNDTNETNDINRWLGQLADQKSKSDLFIAE